VASVSPARDYRALDAGRIVETADVLSRRIEERFPDSGLGRLSRELLAIARTTAERVQTVKRPHWPTRLLVAATIAGMVVLAAWTLRAIETSPDPGAVGVGSAVQIFESLVNDIVFIGIAVAFLLSLEPRRRRRSALRAIHELRTIAHLVDMHQLVKDPESTLAERVDTESSPHRTMTRYELARYLDYCSEMLALTSKLAALYAQNVDDAVVLGAVNDVETLTSGLSGKIWQKIMILDMVGPRQAVEQT
jgi:hypothetical protein